MQTRILNKKLLTLLVAVLTLSSQAEDFTKKISKSFDVDKNATLVLQNKFGKIHCTNWDKNSVSIEVEITVEASSQDKANKFFERISVDISGTSSRVSAITKLDDMFKSNNTQFRIDFLVSMPASLQVEINHKFGDLIMEKVTGNSLIDLSYGTLNILRLEGMNNKLDIKFSTGKIGFIKNGDLDIQYSEMEIPEAGSLTAESKFSEFEVGRVDVLTLDSGYDDDLIGFVRDADVKASFSDVEIRSLQEKIVASLDYGELKIKEVGAQFTLVDIASSFADANIGINPEASFRLVATVKMGDMNYPRNNARISELELSFTSKKYEGIIGPGENPVARVMIDSKNGGVNLYYR